MCIVQTCGPNNCSHVRQPKNYLFPIIFYTNLVNNNENKIIKMAVNFNVFYVYDLYIFITRKNYMSKIKINCLFLLCRKFEITHA